MWKIPYKGNGKISVTIIERRKGAREKQIGEGG